MAESCDFRMMKDELIQDRLMIGIRNIRAFADGGRADPRQG